MYFIHVTSKVNGNYETKPTPTADKQLGWEA